MSEPVDLKLCHACRTGIQASARTCPVCGAPQPTDDATRTERRPPVDPFEALGGMPLGATDGRSILGTMAKGFLGRNRGCLLTILLFVFGPPIHVPSAGSNRLTTGWLVWLLRGSSGGGRG